MYHAQDRAPPPRGPGPGRQGRKTDLSELHMPPPRNTDSALSLFLTFASSRRLAIFLLARTSLPPPSPSPIPFRTPTSAVFNRSRFPPTTSSGPNHDEFRSYHTDPTCLSGRSIVIPAFHPPLRQARSKISSSFRLVLMTCRGGGEGGAGRGEVGGCLTRAGNRTA